MTDFTAWSATALDIYIQARYAEIAALRRQMKTIQREVEEAAREMRRKLVRA